MDIKIVKSGKHCHSCEMDFIHDQEIHSVVRILDHQLAREDYCSACWPTVNQEALYSLWKTTYYDPSVAEAQPAEHFSPLRQTFYDAVEGDDRIQLAVAYLASQLLRRQKVFRLIKESDGADGEPKVALFSDRLGGRLIEVKDPDLTHAEMEQGRVVLMERLYALETDDAEEPPTEDDVTTESDSLEHATSAETDD
jgi:hypothetical protein